MERAMVGRVLACLPDISAVVVDVEPTDDSTHGPLVAYVSRDATGAGGAVSQLPTEGSSVALLVQEGLGGYAVAHCLGTLNGGMDDMTDSLEHRRLLNVDDWSGADAEAPRDLAKLVLAPGVYSSMASRANGADPDTMPGDTDVGRGPVGLHVGRDLAVLSGSPLAQVMVTSMDDRVSATGASVATMTPGTESEDSIGLSVRNVSLGPGEALGDDGASSLSATRDGGVDAMPLFRLQSVAGQAVDGLETSVLGHTEGGTHTDGAPPPMLSNVRHGSDGELSSVSALGVASVKTPYVPGVLQSPYEGRGDTELRQPSDTPQEIPSDAQNPPDEETEIMDAALNRLIDGLLEGDYREAVLKAMARHGLSVTRREGAVLQADLPGGPVDGEAYPPPESVELTDRVTGKVTRYYATSSFITQEPDGSICLCDGYGSEIRMSRGAIHISPALDLHLRPGRDLSAMAGRHQSYNSQGTCTLNAGTDAYVRAVGSMRIGASLDGGEGIMVDAGKGGLALHSGKGTSITSAGDVLVGRASGVALSDSGVTAPTSSGSVVIDAGSSGAVSVHAGGATVDAGEVALCASADGASGTAVTVSPGAIGLYARTVLAPADLAMQAPASRPSLKVARNGRETSVPLEYSGSASMVVPGSVVVGGSMVANGVGKFNQGVIARGVQSVSPECAVDTRRSADVIFRRERIQAIRTPLSYGSAVAASAAAAAAGVAGDAWVTGGRFRFPDDYGVAMRRMPGMVWQDRTRNAGTGSVWRESYVTASDGSRSAGYPGLRVWDSAELTRSGYRSGPLSSTYAINV